MDTYEIIKELAKERRISIRQLEKDFGYSNGYIGSWKRQTPNSIELARLADYFGVSVDYLLGRDQTKEASLSGPGDDIAAFFRLNTSNLETDDIDELEDELKDYAQFLIQRAIEKKKRREQ